MAHATEHHITRETPESLFYERCWRCRCVVPNGLVQRRTVKMGYSCGISDDLTHYKTVSLCGVCAAEVSAEEREELVRYADQSLRWVRALMGLWGTLCLYAVGVPVLLGLVLMWGLARLRIIGRCVVTMHGTALVAEQCCGWLAQRHTVTTLTTWGILVGLLALWQMTHAPSLLWPFGGLVRKRHPRLVQQPSATSATSLPNGGAPS